MDDINTVNVIDEHKEEEVRAKGKKKINKTFLDTVVRIVEVIIITLVLSFIPPYMAMYLQLGMSFKMLELALKMLRMFAFLAALVFHGITAAKFYQRIENNLKKYFAISYGAYSIVIIYSFLLRANFEGNDLLYNFTLSILRAFELFYEKNIPSMIVAHILIIAVMTVVPLVLRRIDEKKNSMAKLVAESQDDFDKMGMVFDPDELPDLPVEEQPQKDREKTVGLLFDPDELPDETEIVNTPADAIDTGYAGGLLFDPDELPEHTKQNEQAKKTTEEKAVGLLFDPDELPDPVDVEVKSQDLIDMGYAGGLLFNPDDSE